MDNREMKPGAEMGRPSDSPSGQKRAHTSGQPGAYARWARLAYAVLAFIFVACVGVQVFLAGMGIFVSTVWWNWHTQFVHTFELLPLVLIVLAFVGQLSRGIRWLTGAAFVLLVLQYAFVNIGRDLGIPTVAALHVVNASLIFWVAATLTQRAVWAERAHRNAIS